MPHEPLTPEERALAQSLSRLGPHGGPSPDLDARILGAARAAVQAAPAGGGQVPPTRRRWPLGMGVAASVLLAAGIAWQLRPMHDVPVASEVPTDTSASAGVPAGNVDVAAADAAAPVPITDSPPARMVAEEAPAPMAAKVMPPPPVGRAATASGPARQNAEAAARQEPAPRRSPLAIIPPAPPSPPAPAAAEAAPQAFPVDADAYLPSAPAPAAAAVPEAAQRERMQYRAATPQEQEQRLRYDEARRDAAAKAEDSRTLDAVTVTGSRVSARERRARAAEITSIPAPPAAPPAPPAPAASAGSIQPSAARNALRRTDLQVPVDADTRLPPEEWLDRIRLRRDLGDDANALRSLQLFVQEHPFQRVPDDLRPLLGNP
ncbi:hypothetical protein [Pseudoxanthomonas sp.]|uniref:hypothetical protein n=1 Tax=Pseudoxanthomonas sp. TaxID=1871049 RepID=UPI002E1534ED|nr:hypothetical protein [Pseudoxanthomonas sp.]